MTPRLTHWLAMLLVALLSVAAPRSHAQEPQLVPDVSDQQIDIRYSFTGADLLLFGAILYPGGRAPDDDADIVVVLKGPSQAITLREKQRIAGIWLNAASAKYRSAPSYYAVASSKPIAKLVDERTAAIYELGLSNLSLSPTGAVDRAEAQRFEAGLIDLYRRQAVYFEDPKAVSIRHGVLYRARLSIPSQVPVGTFSAETYLIRKGRVLAVGSREIIIRKSGFERFVANAATHYGLLYGLVAVALSLAFGWLAGQIFARR